MYYFRDFKKNEVPFFMSLSQEEKKSLIKNLIDLAVVDGAQNMDEIQFIKALAKGAGINDEELSKISDSKLEFSPPRNEFDRIEHMHKLMLLMATDQTFSDVEKDFIQNIGLRMGIRPQATITLMSKLEKSPKNLLTPEEIIAVYKTYYN